MWRGSMMGGEEKRNKSVVNNRQLGSSATAIADHSSESIGPTAPRTWQDRPRQLPLENSTFSVRIYRWQRMVEKSKSLLKGLPRSLSLEDYKGLRLYHTPDIRALHT